MGSGDKTVAMHIVFSMQSLMLDNSVPFNTPQLPAPTHLSRILTINTVFFLKEGLNTNQMLGDFSPAPSLALKLNTQYGLCQNSLEGPALKSQSLRFSPLHTLNNVPT